VVALTVLLSVLTSTHIRYVRVLSVWSMWLFGGLVAAMWLSSGMGVTGFAGSAAHIGAYFANLPRFVVPMSDYHAFYLFWWFSWSIMIGQFVSRFVGGLRTWQLAVALLVIPSIPLGTWFSVLYFYYRRGVPVHPVLTSAMIAVGILFVINSLDSLIRLYSDNLELTARRLGTLTYVAGHWLLMYALVLAFQFTPLQIEWIGLMVIGLYAAIYLLLWRRWRVRREVLA
jgi:choline-glycine betaine transporter